MTNKAETYQQITAKCWADDAFKQRLIADLAATLQAEGMALPEGIKIEVRENTDQEFYKVVMGKICLTSTSRYQQCSVAYGAM